MNTLTPSPIPSLAPTRRRELRALAHPLKPVVSISQKGLTETVLKEIDRCLTSHELIKIRVYDTEREKREELLTALCAALAAAPVQHIGHLLVVWRENPKAEAPAETTPASTRRRAAPKLTKKAAAAKTDKAARSRPITKGKPRRPTRT
ncbi:MAG: YhbY family RNA-binding protein [Proteobacteria bacterium]|nr:YhbY family RNA-binding protein [Pseudomonadota bacterium]